MRRHGASALCILAFGCLGPLESDRPGYSRHLLPEGSQVPLARDDYESNHKVDENDGLEMGAIPLHTGFAAGQPVSYWDFGVAKASIAPLYYLTHCDASGSPLPGGELAHPWIWDGVPGDADYTPFRALYPACVTRDYRGEVIPSTEALSDAIDMGLVAEPAAPTQWLNAPVIASGVIPDPRMASGQVLVADRLYDYASLDLQEGRLPYADKRISARNVYEISFAGSMKVERVVFAQGLLDEAGLPNAAYAPAWKVIAVTLAEGSDLSLFDRESALVTVDEKGNVKPAAPEVVSAKPTGETVNRPHARSEEPVQ